MKKVGSLLVREMRLGEERGQTESAGDPQLLAWTVRRRGTGQRRTQVTSRSVDDPSSMTNKK